MAIDAYLVFTPGSGNAPATPGESQSTNHPGSIEISSYVWGTQTSVNIGSGTAGKPTPLAFTITKAVDSATPPLFRALTGGLNYATMTLYITKQNGSGAPVDYLIYTFSLVEVSSLRHYYSAGDPAPTEEVVLAFGSLQVSYAKQNPDGSYSPPTKGGWNYVTNVAI